MITRFAQMLMIILFLSVVTACMNLGGPGPSTRFYLLESNPDSVLSFEGTNKEIPLSIGVGPITFPMYLDRPQMVTRMEGHELRVDEFNQWAEPLKANISRVMVENLSFLTGSERIYSHPLKRSDKVRLRIFLHLLQFEADADGYVTLRSIWRIVDSDEGQLLSEKQSNIVKPAAGTAAAQVVEAMSEALFELSGEIAGALTALTP